jgi:3-polyprenyl-4-hydroxybenzoate decarboxylase
MSRIMSRIASMVGTDPPGELIQRLMSRWGSPAESSINCVHSLLPPSWSSSGPEEQNPVAHQLLQKGIVVVSLPVVSCWPLDFGRRRYKKPVAAPRDRSWPEL